MAQVTFDPTNAEDVALVEQILAMERERFARPGPPNIGEPQEAELSSTAGAMVSTLWGRFGEKNRRYVHSAAELEQREGSFTLDTLAHDLGVTRDEIGRWKYGLGRSLKRIAREMPDAPPLFHAEWDGEHQVYTMDPAVREAVLAQPVA
jgi:hypothetical protein